MSVSDPATGSRCEFRTYHKTSRKDGETVVKSVADLYKAEVRKDDAYALVVWRNYADKQEKASVTLKVNSPHLLKVFRQIVKSYPAVPSDFNSPFKLSSPFQMLMHWWDEIDLCRKEADDADVRMHLNLLFEFMEFEIGPAREEIMATAKAGSITYFNAWILFRPGDLVYAKVLGHPWLLTCQKTAYEISTKKGPYLEVHCTYTDHDGTRVGKAKHTFVMYQKRQFGQENPAVITDLPVYPRKFVKGEDDLEARLVKRGERFLDYRTVSVQEYDGIAHYLKEQPYSFWHPEMDEFDGIWLPYTETGRVILDRKTFQEDQYSNQVGIKVAEPEPLLCPPYAVGYSLNRKDWCHFLVDNISAIKWKESVWDSLILNDEHKLILRGLVTSHSYPDNPRNQPEQKGKGLVILLHGTPGSGKTLSAETAAEGTHKALLSTSLGELDRDNIPWTFEWRLKQIFQYATRWKAVILLDEADVFLQARNETGGGDSKRNAMVAIFLRELEYFSGIVFLTTNLLRSFDKAIRSRIHLALSFDPPTRNARGLIWTQYLKKVPADEIDVPRIGEAVEELEARQLNGREILNALSMARTIARFQGAKLQLRHIEDVLQVRDAFDKRIREEARALIKPGQSEVRAGTLLRHNSILSEEPDEYE